MFRLFLSLVLLPTLAYGQVSAPQSVPSGEAIHFQLQDDEAGCKAQWLLLNPFNPNIKVKEIKPSGSNDFIVDPPCGWSGPVRVQVIVLDPENRVKDIRVAIVQVGAEDEDEEEGEDDPPPPTPPSPTHEYDGPNDLGVGKVSFDNSPESSEAIASLMRRAAGYIKGRPSLKVIASSSSSANQTDYNVFVWLEEALTAHPAWDGWYDAVMKKAKESGVRVGSPINSWVQVFNEAAEGARAKR